MNSTDTVLSKRSCFQQTTSSKDRDRAVSYLGVKIDIEKDYDETDNLGSNGTILCLTLMVVMVTWSPCALKDNYLTKTNKQYHSMLFQNIK